MAPPEQPARPFLVPVGLLALVPLYLVSVSAVLLLHYVWSDDFQAAQHWSSAQTLLGRDGGRHLSLLDLERAYVELLEAAEHKPDVQDFHEELEHLNWRFDERHEKVPTELRHRADSIGLRFTQIQEERRPILAVGIRDRGWDPDQWLAGPLHVMIGGGIGLVFLLGLIAHRIYTDKQVAADDQVAEQKRRIAEIKALGKFRR